MSANIMDENEKKLAERGLPKWPQMIVTGEAVTVEQALEIIRRTDSFFGHGWGGNDQKYSKWVKEVVHYPDLETYPIERFSECFEEISEWKANWGYIETEYVRNSWIASSYIGGPCGWMHPDGNIGFAENVGKWPDISEVYGDWASIAVAFPFLSLEVTLMNGEHGEFNTKPVVSFLIRNGEVKLIDPEERDIHAENGRIKPAECGTRFDLWNLNRERGLPPSQIQKWSEQIFGKKEDAE